VATDRSRALSDGEGDLVRELYPKLRRFAAVVAPMDVDPDDLMQEALVRTLGSHRLRDLHHPSAYLWRVMCSLASDHRRAQGRRRAAVSRLRPLDAHIDAYPSDLAELELLSPRARAVLYLHDVEGLPFRDVAEMLGGREASLRRVATRARRSLRHLIDEEEADATV
jgi:RNA polymerase sigma factor (sigma-70 family)